MEIKAKKRHKVVIEQNKIRVLIKDSEMDVFKWNFDRLMYPYTEIFDCHFKSILSVDIHYEDVSGIKKTILGSLVAGGLGAIAANINDQKDIFVFITSETEKSVSIPCQNLGVANQIVHAVETKRSKFKPSSISYNSNQVISGETTSLKNKLSDLDNLLKDNIITKDEYDLKRKQIIEQF